MTAQKKPTPDAVFKFESATPVRMFNIDGNPWFAAVDVCKALGLTNSRMSLKALDDDEKGVSSTYTVKGTQTVNVINESGLYTLILRCRDAVTPGTIPYRFRKWVTCEVLPQIRKTGRYVRDELSPEEKAKMVAQTMASSMMPAIMDALMVDQQKYNYPMRSGYIDHIHTSEGVQGLAQQSNLMALLRELRNNGNDVEAPIAEFTAMVNYITAVGRCLRDIQTHAQYINGQASGY